MERAIFTNTSSRPLLSLFLWQLLIMVWGSLRFDDALHTSPRDITMREEGLQVWSWQTKVERARRGTRTIVCRASLSGEDWLSQGWDLWRQLCPPSYFQSDFFLFEHALDGPHYSTPAGYTGFVFNMRAALAHVLLQDSVSEEVRVKLSPLIHKFTAHSLRCTVVSALAKQGVDPIKNPITGALEKQQHGCEIHS